MLDSEDVSRAGSDSTTAVWLDGRSSRCQSVRVHQTQEHGADCFDIIDTDGQLLRVFAPSDVAVSARLAGVVRRLSFKDGATLEVRDDDWVDRCFARRNRVEALVERLERGFGRAALFGLAGLLVAGLMWQLLLPWVVARVVDRVPWSTEQLLGEQVLPLLAHLGLGPSTLSEQRQSHYRQLFEPLCARLPSGSGCALEFRSGPANAYALPGGTVVFTDSLVQVLRSDAEFLAVAGHEIGHVQSRDALHSVVRSTLMTLLLSAASGDVTVLALGGGSSVLQTLHAGHSREAEQQADLYAFEVLRAAGHSPAVFADVIERMSQLHQQQTENDVGDWMSSHPADEDRIAAARAAALASP